MMCSRCKKRPAVVFITKVEGEKSTPEGLCIKCASELNIGPVKQMMESMGITADDIDEASEQLEAMMGSLSSDLNDDEDSVDDFETGGASTAMPPFLKNLFGDNLSQNNDVSENKNSEKKDKSKEKKNKKRKYLNLYCTNLTQKAKEGKIDRIIGRDDEIYRVTQILCRRTKNNPCLIGEPGVGKTAIAEGLSLKIANGDVPAKLVSKEIHLLDLTALVAGTQFRGQFESRIKGLVEEVKSEGNIILFIDEVHNLVGTGDSEGSMNAANILKPALSRGEIQIIGATTFNEYRKFIEKDSALERRLQPVKVLEPSIEDSYKMLLGIKDYYENFHRVKINDSLVYKAVVLSERYITDRFLPDKAIDLLDEACTCANLRNKHISQLEIAENTLKNLKIEEQLLNEDTENLDYEAISKVKAEIIVCEEKIKNETELAKDNAVTQD
ncbi:MAG: ATP-dependent Clp protease ATP-binding subunit, partial [Clostridia bacterium]|nr:ATP-dependent Clp protease ATP-binding subunit [Clostridia bacterium]